MASLECGVDGVEKRLARKGPEGTDQHTLSAFPCLNNKLAHSWVPLGYAMLGSMHHASCVRKILSRTSADARNMIHGWPHEHDGSEI